MGIKQLYNANLRKSPNEYGDVSVMVSNNNNKNEKKQKKKKKKKKTLTYLISVPAAEAADHEFDARPSFIGKWVHLKMTDYKVHYLDRMMTICMTESLWM